MKSVVARIREAVTSGIVLAFLAAGRAQMPVLGDYWAHDPSTMIKDGSRYYVFRTSQGIMGKYSADLRNWTYSGQEETAGNWCCQEQMARIFTACAGDLRFNCVGCSF